MKSQPINLGEGGGEGELHTFYCMGKLSLGEYTDSGRNVLIRVVEVTMLIADDSYSNLQKGTHRVTQPRNEFKFNSFIY
jgi:hypothetical protein